MPARTNKAAEAVVDPDHSSSEPEVEAIASEEGGSEDEGKEGSSSRDGSDGGSHEDSDSDSLDSNAPRKRRRISPQPVGDDDDDDEDDEEDAPKAPVSFISAPSRIKKNTAPDAQAKPQYPSKEDVAPPADDLNGGISAPVDPSTTFESLGVKPWLVQSLSNMAIKRPTGIQKGCIPEILNGKDCIGGSRTGSGKTVAFAVPILQRWAEDPSAIYAVVLTPTR